jgi:hypothetical protein
MVVRWNVDDSKGFLRDSVKGPEGNGRIGSTDQLSYAPLESVFCLPRSLILLESVKSRQRGVCRDGEGGESSNGGCE